MQNSRRFSITVIAIMTLSSGVMAHSGATGVVKDRMDLMGEVAKSTKIIASMIASKTPFDPELLSSAAQSLANHATKMPGLFPEASINGPSEARPEIWEDWETFSKIANQMRIAANNIAADTSSIEAAKPNFAALAQTCSACHEKFRLKK